MSAPRIFSFALLNRAQRTNVKYIIFWAPGCPFSEKARQIGLKLRKKGIKVKLVKVGGKYGISDREKIDKAASELRELLETKTLIVTWPQVFYFHSNKKIYKRLSGGYEDLVSQKDVRDLD